MKNVRYKKRIKSTSWRKISIGSWRPTGDSSIHAFEQINIEDAKDWCDKIDIKLNTFILKALAKTIEKEDRVNAVVRWGKLYQREDIKLFYHVLPSLESDDLSGALLVNPQDIDISELNKDLWGQVKKIRSGDDPFKRSKRAFRFLPGIVARKALDFMSFVMYSLNIRPFFFPSDKDPFGSVMVTHIGSMNLTQACTPIAPYTKIPMVIAVGKEEKRAVVENDEIVVREMITFGFTFDHRIMEGIHFARFIKCFRKFFEQPNEL